MHIESLFFVCALTISFVQLTLIISRISVAVTYVQFSSNILMRIIDNGLARTLAQFLKIEACKPSGPCEELLAMSFIKSKTAPPPTQLMTNNLEKWTQGSTTESQQHDQEKVLKKHWKTGK